eukprot:CAMPEP_0181468914 /NCGR_PEP_ID=MMETSP1110-20121109/37733_1 /TAXON_ID=174948 /ORGANISM="Symbiodinium sp., Strain CCMP421" /LENGTH=239 /DNA_ID=CAMNT_0023593773 /DNA_START=171 /DNA_END=889 /DNA_ORIENTATION=-
MKAPDGFLQSIIRVRQYASPAPQSSERQRLVPPALGNPEAREAAAKPKPPGSSERCICVSETNCSGQRTRATSSKVGLYLHGPAARPSPDTRTFLSKLYSHIRTKESPAPAIAEAWLGFEGSALQAAAGVHTTVGAAPRGLTSWKDAASATGTVVERSSAACSHLEVELLAIDVPACVDGLCNDVPVDTFNLEPVAGAKPPLGIGGCAIGAHAEVDLLARLLLELSFPGAHRRAAERPV